MKCIDVDFPSIKKLNTCAWYLLASTCTLITRRYLFPSDPKIWPNCLFIGNKISSIICWHSAWLFSLNALNSFGNGVEQWFSKCGPYIRNRSSQLGASSNCQLLNSTPGLLTQTLQVILREVKVWHRLWGEAYTWYLGFTHGSPHDSWS